MHLTSIIFASLAIMATASARPIGFFGSLPQILITNATTILADLKNVDDVATKLSSTLAQSGADSAAIIESTIGLQFANRQVMLHAEDLNTTFTAEESEQILNRIKDDLVPHFNDALSKLQNARSSLSVFAKTFIGPYLKITQTEFDALVETLTSSVPDGDARKAVQEALDNLRKPLASSVTAYTG